jgi:GNAT superfamily N-acetyltransferase
MPARVLPSRTDRGIFTAELIRFAKKEDLNDLLSLYTYLNTDDPTLIADTRVRELWDMILADPGQLYLVVEVDGKLVSTCVLIIVKNLTRCATPYALIENVVTRPEYRNRGIGTRLLKRAKEIAQERGCYKVMLLTGRKEAIGFYENAGFDGQSKTGFIIRFDGH